MRAVALIVVSLLAASEAGACVYADEASLQIKTPTREEFQKLYIYIDSAIASGDAKQLAIVALPSAEIHGRTGEDRRQLSVFIATYKAGLPRESRIICRSTVQDVQLSGDTAVVLVKMEFAVASDSGRPAQVFYNLDAWTMTADGWKLRERTHLSSRITVPRTDPDTAQAVAAESDVRAKGASEQAVAVLKVFDSKRAALEKASSPAAWRDARQAASVAYQACSMRIPGNGADYRDEMMAKNVEWLAGQVFPNEKLVLWAHNNHVRIGGDVGHKSMGTWLRNRFGQEMHVTGFAFRGGQLRAIGLDGGRFTGLAVHDAPPAPEGFGDAVLSAAGMPLFFLDMSGVPANSALGRWLGESHLYYSAGAGWKTYDAKENLYPRKLSREFDGLIFVEVSQAANALHKR